jgi:hypothetical protein
MNWPVILLVVLVLLLAAAGLWLALGDSRADREHARWMRRDELRRRRTQVEVSGIRRGYRGTGLDGRTRPVSDRARR